ncbi:MAG TPA: N-acetylmuramoyl-L-alanine amidase [Saprospiraceae bacterium]|nr:N-acetylmuramoyl-L-alanine amidase [Saprospiraceae bacterium]HMQ83226.1 N-acetylmuramoyl-L-alanine amidase [Saprospiraceae bacterium]
MKESNRFSREFEVLLVDGRDYEISVTTKTLTYWVQESLNIIENSGLTLTGRLDDATKIGIRAFQTKQGLPATGNADPVTERRMMEERALKTAGLIDSVLIRKILQQAQTKIEDWTAHADPPTKGEKARLVTSEYRNLKNVWAVVLHHMAFKRLNKRGEYSAPESYLRTRAHFCILFDGKIIQLYPISRKIWHSNCTSPGSVGIEFEGNFPNVDGKWWYPRDKKTGRITARDEDHPTKAQVEAGRFLVQYLQKVAGFKEVLAHRQSSEDRTNDPGPDIWYNVGQWAVNNLGMGDGGTGFKCGHGNPILPVWRNWHDRNLVDGVIPVITPRPAGSGRSTPANNNQDTAVPKVHRANRYYAEKLGWDAYRMQIYPLLGFPDTSPSEDLFAEAVANWQRQNGFSAKDSDGILGSKTWEKMKAILRLATPQPTSASAPASGGLLSKIAQFQPYIDAASREFGVSPNIIRAVIAAESGGDPRKTSSASYKGLMQAEKTDDQYDPQISIRTGTRKFANFMNKYLGPRLKNYGIDVNLLNQKTLLSLTIASYNAGHVTVLKALEYAHAAGNWQNWLSAEYYQRALVFSGGYHMYEKCTQNAVPSEIAKAKLARSNYAGWRTTGISWQKFADPPTLEVLNLVAPSIMMCWVKTKHGNTTPYINKFLRYL